YKHLIGEDWDKVLPGALAETQNAKDALGYHKAIARLVARTNDTHCYMNSPVLRAWWGAAIPPLLVRWIENRPVGTSRLADAASAGIERGDVVVAIDGRPVEEHMEELRPLLAASTPQSKQARILGVLLNGADGSSVKLTVEKAGGERKEITVPRSTRYFA